MAQIFHAKAVHARVDARFRADQGAVTAAPVKTRSIRLSVEEDFGVVERDWRAFEAGAELTVFQTFDWLSTWQRHIGRLTGVCPAIVVARDASGILFILPLATHDRTFYRELTWLGSELCDYNAPLLASDFAQRCEGVDFVDLWAQIASHLQGDARHRFDAVRFTNMPAMVGGQANPMLALGVVPHPSGAYATRLGDDWDSFYAAKRSSTTRRRDRTKRKRLGEFGEVRMVNPERVHDILAALDVLMQQKTRQFARMGVADLFAKPGYADFYRALARDPLTRPLVHVSCLNVGPTPAAVNLGLTWRGCYYHLLASYDDGERARFGPGAAHLHDLLKLAIERGLKVFDFTVGDEPYKRDWSDSEIALYDHVAAARWRGALIVLPLILSLRLKRWIKQTPAAWRMFTAVRARLGALTGGRDGRA